MACRLVGTKPPSETTRTTRTPAFWGYPRRLMITHTIESYWIPSQNQFYCEVMAKWPWRYRSRSKALYATHPLMLVIICTKYGKNPSRTVDATERTWFSRPRPNDLEDISQSQRSLYATHPLIPVIICAKYGKNPLRTVDFFVQGQGRKISKKLPKIQIFRFWRKT